MLKLSEEQFAAINRRIEQSAKKVNGRYGLNGAESPTAQPEPPQARQVSSERQERATVQPDAPVSLNLPWPPTVNHYWKLKSNGGRYISAAGVKFRAEVKAAAHGLHNLAGKVEICIRANPPDKRRRDIDNICKALFDALQHANLIGDDFNVEAFSVRRLPVVEGGRVTVTIKPFEEV